MIEESKRNLGIPISSINVPSIQLVEDILKLSFLNWECQNVRVEFASTLAFRWINTPSSDEFDDDKAFEVLNSAWIREVTDSDKALLHHYQFIVTGCWLFEVIAESVGLEVEPHEDEGSKKSSWGTCLI